MTNEKAISIIKNAFSWYEDNARESEDEDWSGQHEALRIAIQALEQQPSEDCISRQAVIDFIIDNYGVGFNSLTNGIRDYLPPVTPKRPKGQWIEHPHERGLDWEYSMFECSKCHEWTDSDYDYCPNCGAKMEVEENV